MSYDDKGHCIVGSGSQSRAMESDTILNGWHTSDLYHRDLKCGPLKEGKEEHFAQLVLHGPEQRPYVHGDALHEIPLLLERPLQAA